MTMVYTGLAISIASVAASTYGAYTQSVTAKKVANRNASMAEMAAQDAQRRGEKDAIAQRQKSSAAQGAQRAALAARGLDLNDGTAGDLQDQTDFFAQSDQATVRNNAAKEAWNKRAQRDGYAAEAESINPTANATATGLAGAASVAGKWYSYGGDKPAGENGLDMLLKSNRGSGD